MGFLASSCLVLRHRRSAQEYLFQDIKKDLNETALFLLKRLIDFAGDVALLLVITLATSRTLTHPGGRLEHFSSASSNWPTKSSFRLDKIIVLSYSICLLWCESVMVCAAPSRVTITACKICISNLILMQTRPDKGCVSLNFTMGFHFFCWIMFYALAVGVDIIVAVTVRFNLFAMPMCQFGKEKKVSRHCRSSDISESHDGKHSIHLR